jgi:hypothetical protein
MLKFRPLKREEIEKIRNIDRSEIIEGVYVLKNGQLDLKNGLIEKKGWDPNEFEARAHL